MPSPFALEVTGVSKLYGRTVALRALSLRVPPGQTLALLGANGSGKTTVLKIIAGAVPPSSGTVSVLGNDVGRDRRPTRSLIGFLAGETYLYDDLTAAENLKFALTMAGCPATATEILGFLQSVHLASHADDRVRSFSSGMKRRLALARVQALRPRLLLLDEPYNSLDADGADLVDRWIGQVTSDGGAAIVATHDVQRVTAYADLVAQLDRGVLRYLGPLTGYRDDHALHVV